MGTRLARYVFATFLGRPQHVDTFCRGDVGDVDAGARGLRQPDGQFRRGSLPVGRSRLQEMPVRVAQPGQPVLPVFDHFPVFGVHNKGQARARHFLEGGEKCPVLGRPDFARRRPEEHLESDGTRGGEILYRVQIVSSHDPVEADVNGKPSFRLGHLVLQLFWDPLRAGSYSAYRAPW